LSGPIVSISGLRNNVTVTTSDGESYTFSVEQLRYL